MVERPPRTAGLDRERALTELRALYDAVDALVAPFGCDASTECCQFGVTGREPYVTRLEEEALRVAVSQKPSPKRLPIAVDVRHRRCQFLDEGGRCRLYAARPLGCRTFFCERRIGPKHWPRKEINGWAQQLLELSLRHFPAHRESRPLSRLFPTRS